MCHRNIWAAFKPIWATFELFGRKLNVGAPELQIDLKFEVTGARNRGEKMGYLALKAVRADQLALFGDYTMNQFVVFFSHFQNSITYAGVSAP